ncbi:MAG: VWA-like domain-containing protein [Saprospiraceae bacterium]
MESQENILNQAKLALQNVLISMPHLAGLVETIKLQAEPRISTAGIFASGRLVFNPEWFDQLSLREATFILAHELMHLMLLTHSRMDKGNAPVFNVAHDLIINNLLENELEMRTPANGLTYRDYLPRQYWNDFERDMPLETLAALLQQPDSKDIRRASAWLSVKQKTSDTALATALKDLVSVPSLPNEQPFEGMDALTPQMELEWYPEETWEALRTKAQQTEEKVYESIGTKDLLERVESGFQGQGRGNESGAYQYTYEALKTHYNPPWQMALQQWMEATSPGPRSYARPSRRGQYPDFVRPGKTREGQTLHIVLDTSGSMSNVLPKALGVIGSFCSLMQIETIHIIQCDTAVTADEWVDTSQLGSFQIGGFGGSDMSAAMQRLAEDQEVERAIVITDGFINYPQTSMPYEVLWVLTANYNSYARGFSPPYGQCIQIDG